MSARRACAFCGDVFTVSQATHKFCSPACRNRACYRRKGRAYKAWQNMRQHCQNPNDPRYEDYGGRGIKVCRRWAVFVNFLVDMGQPPRGAMLERLKNNQGYSPGNCEWATAKQQQRNKRDTHFVVLGGRRQSLSAWAEETGIPGEAIRWRLAAGWPIRRALSETPVLGRNQYGC